MAGIEVVQLHAVDRREATLDARCRLLRRDLRLLVGGEHGLVGFAIRDRRGRGDHRVRRARPHEPEDRDHADRSFHSFLHGHRSRPCQCATHTPCLFVRTAIVRLEPRLAMPHGRWHLDSRRIVVGRATTGCPRLRSGRCNHAMAQDPFTRGL
jgi:hypothetical protein